MVRRGRLIGAICGAKKDEPSSDIHCCRRPDVTAAPIVGSNVTIRAQLRLAAGIQYRIDLETPTDLSGFDIERFDAAPISISAVDSMADKQVVAKNGGRGKNPVRVSCVHSAPRPVRVAANHCFPTQRTVPSVQAVDGLAGTKVDAIVDDCGRRGYDPAISQEPIGLYLIGRETLGRDRYDRVLAI